MSKHVAVFAGGQRGDVMSAMSVLKYRNELWGYDHKITWFINPENRDLLAYHNNIELIDFPRGYGYPEMVIEENNKLIAECKEPIWHDFKPFVDWDNRLNIALKNSYPLLAKYDVGYFPLTHQKTPEQRHGLVYPEVSKLVFGVPFNYAWHPVLNFSEQERVDAKSFMSSLFFLRRTVCIESYAGSGQSLLNDNMVRQTMKICRAILGECNFIFVSHKYLLGNDEFPAYIMNEKGVYSAAHFTVRQCALIIKECDLLVSVSSGVTVASSCWDNIDAKFKVIQYTGSEICSTKAHAIGDFELITYDDLPLHVAENNYYEKLNQILNSIK